MTPSKPEPELRAPGSLRRQCLFAVTILLVEDSRSASEAIRLYAAESGARVRRADSLHAASRHLSEPLGFINTCVLLVSSLTMALAVRCAQLGRQKALQLFIVVTMVLGTVFLVIKGFEYADKIEKILPKLDEMIGGGLITLEKVRVILYRSNK